MTVIINGDTGISGVNGSAATPAIQGGDTDTGIFFGTNEASISTGGTSRLEIDSSGDVCAKESLTINNYGSNTVGARIFQNGGNTGLYINGTGAGTAFGVYNGSASAYTSLIKHDGAATFGPGTPGASNVAATFISGAGTIETQAASGNVFIGRQGSNGVATSTIGQDGLIYTAAGLNFGTPTSPVTSKTLEDYEEGTWTPIINKSGTTGSISSYNDQFGFYRRVGGLLFVSFYAYKAAGTFGTGTNQWYVSGLPYNVLTLANSAYQFIPGGYLQINGVNYNFSSGVGNGEASGVRFQANGVNGAATLSMYGVEHNTNWTSGAIEISGSGVLMLA